MSTDTYDQKWLTELRATLTHEFEAQTARLTQLTADTGDPGEAHTNAALIAATRQSLDRISAALRRLNSGSYGDCERCGTAIPRERLEILPQARFCVPCQQKQNG
ncbi:TraR/DksA family transcriptional regulator [Micromonospora zingiberis]|uniref:TraR/DksA family transcriptional regulator n=1 Tax=Micromonospora zingiberis TaxID=2053011 RepID=A0A4R0GU34_9ACTN|nr:TraR/DksA family transcriptional regulator [Micromonospora zingiberis]TCC00598.1 TraR/DksA family transcriptional regulator [Micromonospora zingiberis]